MRKAFRVATIFTGAAACATVFTPALAANAATNAGTSNPTAGIAPAPLDLMNCVNNGPNTSVHLYWSVNEDHTATCVGNNEVYTTFGTVHYVSLCAGNNSGVFSSADKTVIYHAGGRYGLGNGTAKKIDNETWTGDDKCSFYN